MKQRTRPMHSEDDLIPHNMIAKNNDIDSNSEIQLYRIKPQEHFIEAQVQEGDTLQAIALRFYCTISELKRINHIHKDNEIFARRTIKVPVTPYSVLTELEPVQKLYEPTPSTSNHTPSLIQELLDKSYNDSPSGIQNNIVLNNELDCNAVVLNSTITPSVIPYSDNEQNGPISEDTQLLPNKEKLPVEAVVVQELTSHGADLGLKWFHLVCFMLVLGVVTPLVYVIFFLDRHEHLEMNTHSNR